VLRHAVKYESRSAIGACVQTILLAEEEEDVRRGLAKGWPDYFDRIGCTAMLRSIESAESHRPGGDFCGDVVGVWLAAICPSTRIQWVLWHNKPTGFDIVDLCWRIPYTDSWCTCPAQRWRPGAGYVRAPPGSPRPRVESR
jgi:hypothetical protein